MVAVAVDPGFDPNVRGDEIDAEVRSLAGVMNAAHGSLLLRTADLLADTRLGLVELSARQWLCWKAGLSPARADDIVRLAERISELPCTVAALCAGSLSLDQAAVIARHVPAELEESACEVGKVMTVRQMRRTLPKWDSDAADKEGDGPRPSPTEGSYERSVAAGQDERGWWAQIRLAPDEGAVVEQAWRTMTDDLRRQARLDTPEGEQPPRVGLADGLLAVAEAALRAGEARLPGSDRFTVNVHMEGSSIDGGDELAASWHLGDRLHRSTRRLLTCDPRFRGFVHKGRRPLDVGRATREISNALRLAVERRDGGCMVPGCGARHHLQVHHIVHWEDFGPTDTANLVTLCRRHHRMHHDPAGLLGITGNADLPQGTPGALVFTDHRGRVMESVCRPIEPPSQIELEAAAATVGAAPEEPYRPPLNEPLRWVDFHLQHKPPAQGP